MNAVEYYHLSSRLRQSSPDLSLCLGVDCGCLCGMSYLMNLSVYSAASMKMHTKLIGLFMYDFFVHVLVCTIDNIIVSKHSALTEKHFFLSFEVSNTRR